MTTQTSPTPTTNRCGPLPASGGTLAQRRPDCSSALGQNPTLPQRRLAVRSGGALAWLATVLAGIGALVSPSHSQILQQWTHQSTIGESSAAIAMDENFMFVADNEDETLRLYVRHPDTACAAPVYSFSARPFLNLSSSNPEADLEAAVKWTDADGTRIYWIGSHSNSKSGNLRPNRFRLFATRVSGDGNGAEPYALSHLGRYDHLRTDLIAWDQNNLHGKGPNYFGLAASAAVGVVPTRIDGFNIEGLTLAPDGVTAYLAFRAPLVNGSGPTTSLEQRTHALIVPLLNMPALVAANPTSGPGQAQFGAPCTPNLGARGVRSIDCSYPGHYLITAGPPGEASVPAVAPTNYRLFTWTGEAADAPREQSTEIPDGYTPEGAIVASGPISSDTIVQFVSDDPGGCWRSFTARVAPGPADPPTLQLTRSGRDVVIAWPAVSAGFILQHSGDLLQRNWVDSPSTPQIYGTQKIVVEPAAGIRFYRLVRP